MTSVVTSTITLKPSQAAVAVAALIKARQSVCLWGPPGVGKSDLMAQVSAGLNMNHLPVYASLLDAVDLRGIPSIGADGRTHWATPEFLPRDGTGVLFWDDFTRATGMVMNGIFSLILEGRLGEYTLPAGWVNVAASNRETDGGGVNRMPAALANRFVHLNIEPDVSDWCKWALGANINPLVIAFIRFRPNLLCQFDPKAKAFPTPRSWSFVSKILDQQQANDIEYALVEGTVGQGAAVEFTSFAQIYRSLPSIDAILLDPTQAAVPTGMATLFAVSSALAHRANDNNLARVLQYAARLPKEYEVHLVRDASRRDATLKSHPSFVGWVVQNHGIL